MSRGLLALDRVVVGLLGVLLLLGGSLLAVWGLGLLPAVPGVGTVPAELDLAPLRDAPGTQWWPWALGGVAVLAVLAGARALVAHTVRPRVRDVPLAPVPVEAAAAGAGGASGGDGPGRLHADLPAVADAAAEVLARTPGIEGCRGRALPEPAGPVVELLAGVDASADPAALHRAAEAVADGLARTLPRGTARLRVRLDVRRGRYEAPRVR